MQAFCVYLHAKLFVQKVTIHISFTWLYMMALLPPHFMYVWGVPKPSEQCGRYIWMLPLYRKDRRVWKREGESEWVYFLHNFAISKLVSSLSLLGSQTTKNSSLLMNERDRRTDGRNGAETQLWLSLKFAKREQGDGPFCRGRLSKLRARYTMWLLQVDPRKGKSSPFSCTILGIWQKNAQ